VQKDYESLGECFNRNVFKLFKLIDHGRTDFSSVAVFEKVTILLPPLILPSSESTVARGRQDV